MRITRLSLTFPTLLLALSSATATTGTAAAAAATTAAAAAAAAAATVTAPAEPAGGRPQTLYFVRKEGKEGGREEK